jgi:tRNA pseudouridine38-40 synthase
VVSTTTDDVRLRLDISYDGTDFSGWAVQPGRRTVAGVLTEALRTLVRLEPRLVVAGRTDAGVHATGQVAHLDVGVDRLVALTPRHLRAADRRSGPPHTCEGADGDPPNRPVPAGDGSSGGMRRESLASACLGLERRLAGLLPLDVRVRSVVLAAPGFDARFSAVSRSYCYRIGTADWGVEPANRRFVLALQRPLDAEAMSRSAAALIGLHDFAAYCKRREGATTIRDLQRLDVRQVGDEVVVDVTADAFCHSMVRSLVGALIAVGQHRGDPDAPAALLAAARRTVDIHVAPAHGLTLVTVGYPTDTELARRAEQTRALRRAR